MMERKITNHFIAGFTLIELVIVVLISTILISIAYPSYKSYIRKSRRSDAITTLLAMEAAQEKYRYSNTTYGTLAQVWASQSSSPQGYYTLSITVNSSSSYTLTATANSTGGQNADAENGVSCTPMVLTVSNGVETKTPSACW